MATHTSKSYIIEIKHSFTKCETIFNTQRNILSKIACVTKSFVVVECLTLSLAIVSQELLNLCDIFQL